MKPLHYLKPEGSGTKSPHPNTGGSETAKARTQMRTMDSAVLIHLSLLMTLAFMLFGGKAALTMKKRPTAKTVRVKIDTIPAIVWQKPVI